MRFFAFLTHDIFLGAALQGNRLQGQLPPQLAFLPFLKAFLAGSNRLMGGNIVLQPPTNSTTDNNNSSSRNNDALVAPRNQQQQQQQQPVHVIDQAFYGMSTLQVLVLHDNAFTGHIPIQVCQNNPQLEKLLLGKNQFTGTLPNEFLSFLTNLKELQLQQNKLVGSIPTSFANFSNTLGECLVLSKYVCVCVCLPQRTMKPRIPT